MPRRPVVFHSDDAARIKAAVHAFEESSLDPNGSPYRGPIFKPQGFLIKLTDVDYSNSRYSFSRIEAGSGTWSVNSSWTSGGKSDSSGYVRELNGFAFAPLNEYVWAYPSGNNFFWFQWHHKVAVGKADAGIAKSASGTISVYKGPTAGSETDTTANVTAFNKSGPAISTNNWVWLEWVGTTIYCSKWDC